jgi:uncharacterized membrane protein YbhN (UPF0104 family)
MTAAARRRRGAWIRIGLSMLLVVGIVAVAGDREVIARLRAVPPGAWGLAFLAFLVLHGLSAQKWRLLLGACGAPLPLLTATRCHFSGLCANLFLPSLVGGDLVRAGLAFGPAASKEGVVVASLADRLGDVVGLALLAGGGFVLAPAVAPVEGGLRISPGAAIAVALGGVAGLLLVLGLLSRPRNWRRLPRRFRRIALRLVRAAITLRQRPAALVLALALAVLIQACFVLVNVGLGRAMGWDLDPRLWFLLWPLAKIAAMLPVSLGGLGFREAVFAGLTAPFGAPVDLAVAQSLVWQSVLMAGGVVGGLWWFARNLRLGAREAVSR